VDSAGRCARGPTMDITPTDWDIAGKWSTTRKLTSVPWLE
jgi:hypothetical protein